MIHAPDILLAHDKAEKRRHYESLLEHEGFGVHAVASGLEAVNAVREKDFSVVVLDVFMPRTDEAGVLHPDGGLWALKQMHQLRPHIPVILFSQTELPDALLHEARRWRIFDYLVRGEENFEYKLINRVRNAEEAYISRMQRLGGGSDMLFTSPAMKKVKMDALKAAQSSLPVLVTGETGTGKSMLAREIHRNSARARSPFLELNCASLPETLVESQLFGHVRGAFTGAVSNYRGLFERAHGGTLFLDEIGDMTPATQGKVLKVIEDKTFTPLGSEQSRSADVRLVCATHRDLEQLVKEGKFREDLFYRICYERIHLPPLRERREAIPALVDLFVREHNERYHKKIAVRQDVYEQLNGYYLRGNVRELRALIQASLFRMEAHETELNAFHLGPPPAQREEAGAVVPQGGDITRLLKTGGLDLKQALENYKNQIINRALELNEGVAEGAAKMLRVNAFTLRRHLRQSKLGQSTEK